MAPPRLFSIMMTTMMFWWTTTTTTILSANAFYTTTTTGTRTATATTTTTTSRFPFLVGKQNDDASVILLYHHHPRRNLVLLSATKESNDLDALSSVKDDDDDENKVDDDDITIILPTLDMQVDLADSVYTAAYVCDETMVPCAKKLRAFYDAHFEDPRQPNANRFVWDPWLVYSGDGLKTKTKTNTKTADDDDDNNNDDGRFSTTTFPGEDQATQRQIQYSLKRVTAEQFFSQNNNDDDLLLYQSMIDKILHVASSVGLTALTPPWLSLYTQDDMQNFHTDAPHGPLAFVWSLCPNDDESSSSSSSSSFQGGETMLLQPQMLDYWKRFDGTKGLECQSILRYIPPRPLGRFLAFDPRIPHGVNRVTGTQDPRHGRLVLHGWLNEPQVCWFGPLWKEDDQALLDTTLENIVEALSSDEDLGRVMGYLAVRLHVDEDGTVDSVQAVCDTLQADGEDFRGIIGFDPEDRPIMEDAVSDVKLTILEALKQIEFGEVKSNQNDEMRSVVVPFLFE